VTDRPRRFPLGLDKLGTATPTKPVLMPQRHLREAVADAARLARPSSGIGLDSAQVRLRMVQRLRAEGLADERVLDAFAAVPRHVFVDSALATQAYEDTSLPIGHGQTISKPSVVGRMIALLLQGQTASTAARLGRVLEIGSGCGYQAAVLAQLARQVVSIERIRPLHDKARENLAQAGGAGAGGVRLVYGDGRLGHAPAAPFDAIIAAAGGEDIPPAWIEQLAPGGRLVAPMARGRGQVLVVIDKLVERGQVRLQRSEQEAVLFVPLESGVK